MPGKRKQSVETEGSETKKRKNNTLPTQKDKAHSILGGLKGGYRVTGDEPSSASNKTTFKVPFEGKEIICERRHGGESSDKESKPELIFTHGAGGGIANPATASFADGFSEVGNVVCFQGTMNLQSRVKTFHAVIEHEGTSKALGGRSMGARAAVITALESEEKKVEELILVSYPLVGAGKGDIRDAILKDLGDDIDVLFIVGSEDSMCDIAHLNKVREKMTASTWLVEVEGADHGMSLKSKKWVESTRQKTGSVAAKWLQQRDRDKTYCSIGWSKERDETVVGGWVSENTKTKGDPSRPAGNQPKAKHRG